MASISLKLTTIMLLIFSTLSITMAFVLDTDGEPVFNNGGQYYILLQNIGFGGGLTTTTKSADLPCPFYITRDNDETSNGLPVTISSPLRILYVPLSTPVSIAFEDILSICIQSMKWRVIPDESTGQSYVATGASARAETFTIEQAESESVNNLYKIRYVGVSGAAGDLGFFNKDGLLGVTDEIPVTFMFKKAFNVIQETTSRM